jgi:hypothetical protein
MKDSCGCPGNIPRSPSSPSLPRQKMNNWAIAYFGGSNCSNRLAGCPVGPIYSSRGSLTHTAVVDSSSQIPSFRRRGSLISKHISSLGTNRNMIMDPDGARNWKWLCWRGPAVICSSAATLIAPGTLGNIFPRYVPGSDRRYLQRNAGSYYLAGLLV